MIEFDTRQRFKSGVSPGVRPTSNASQPAVSGRISCLVRAETIRR